MGKINGQRRVISGVQEELPNNHVFITRKWVLLDQALGEYEQNVNVKKMGNGHDNSNISKIFGILRMINRSINYKRKEVTLTLYDTDLEDYPNSAHHFRK